MTPLGVGFLLDRRQGGVQPLLEVGFFVDGGQVGVSPAEAPLRALCCDSVLRQSAEDAR